MFCKQSVYGCKPTYVMGHWKPVCFIIFVCLAKTITNYFSIYLTTTTTNHDGPKIYLRKLHFVEFNSVSSTIVQVKDSMVYIIVGYEKYSPFMHNMVTQVDTSNTVLWKANDTHNQRFLQNCQQIYGDTNLTFLVGIVPKKEENINFGFFPLQRVTKNNSIIVLGYECD